MQVRHLHREQFLPLPPHEVFAFFADVRNLESITPGWLNFRVSTRPGKLEAGAKIVHRLSWHGLPLRWVTEITEWNPPHRFVDVQRFGPYRQWRHTHEFHSEKGGTRMTDTVEYALWLGPVGGWIHRLAVGAELERIFDFRAREIGKRFLRAG